MLLSFGTRVCVKLVYDAEVCILFRLIALCFFFFFFKGKEEKRGWGVCRVFSGVSFKFLGPGGWGGGGVRP